MGNIIIGIMEPKRETVIESPKMAAKFLNDVLKLSDMENEVYSCLYLDSELGLRGYGNVAAGTLMAVACEPKNILKWAITDKFTKYVIVAHNHPGQQSPKPSDTDIDRIKEHRVALSYMSFPMLDSLILGLEGYYSFSEHGKVWRKSSTYLDKKNKSSGGRPSKATTRAKKDVLPYRPLIH